MAPRIHITLFDDEDRDGSVRQQLCRLAAEQQPVGAAPVVTADDDQVGASRPSHVKYGLGRPSLGNMHERNVDAYLASVGLHFIQDLVGLLLSVSSRIRSWFYPNVSNSLRQSFQRVNRDQLW